LSATVDGGIFRVGGALFESDGKIGDLFLFGLGENGFNGSRLKNWGHCAGGAAIARNCGEF
jgi:hypothetical protein